MHSKKRLWVVVVSLAVGIMSLVSFDGVRPAAASVANSAASAVTYANQHGYRSSIGVLDSQTGSFAGAGDYNSAYASESVMKLFIATRLLMTGQMSGWNQTTAYKMITQSDDASANALYGRTGGDSIIIWVRQALNVSNLGSPPLRAGWWGGTQINARGMSAFYNAIRHRADVWPWIGNAMHHATTYGSDGTYQFFGLPSATSGPAIKQGWGADNAAGQPAFNSTGFVNSDRYAVVILTQGGVYGAPISNMLTTEARLLMPGGRVPVDSPNGRIESIDLYGNNATVRGWSFDPNATATAIKMVVYVNGDLAAYGPSAVARPDVNAAFHISGTHGYSMVVKLADGTNTVCVYAINLGPGANVALGCQTMSVPGSPVGPPPVVNMLANRAAISGWTYDYDAPASPSTVVIYRNGRLATYGMTSTAQPDLNSRYRTSGTHGYQFTLTLPDGPNTLCVYSINVGRGSNATLGCPLITLSGSPVGHIDQASVDNGSAIVRGWTFDYDDPAQAIQAVLYLNGRLAAYGQTSAGRDDVNTVFGIAGTHGFSYTQPLPAGTNTVCVYGINVATGSNTTLGCAAVTR